MSIVVAGVPPQPCRDGEEAKGTPLGKKGAPRPLTVKGRQPTTTKSPGQWPRAPEKTARRIYQKWWQLLVDDLPGKNHRHGAITAQRMLRPILQEDGQNQNVYFVFAPSKKFSRRQGIVAPTKNYRDERMNERTNEWRNELGTTGTWDHKVRSLTPGGR